VEVLWRRNRLLAVFSGYALSEDEMHFRSVTDGIDTKTTHGRFFFHVMASLAQMERELILERTRAGLEAARLQGRVGGRKQTARSRRRESYWQAGHRHAKWGTAWASRPPRYIGGARLLTDIRTRDGRVDHFGQLPAPQGFLGSGMLMPSDPVFARTLCGDCEGLHMASSKV
jgi:hypothetical protein